MAESAAPWNKFIQYAALSDLGLRRANNQDSYSVALAGDELEWRRRGHLFMVADGMGAHAAGEMASRLACHGVTHTYRKLLDRAVPDALRQALTETNADIHSRGQANIDFHGMGTTTSVLVLLPQGAVAAHVGDSRVYRLRQQKLEQLTFDHSLVWEMRAAGQLPAGDLPSYVPKNIITRSLGPHPSVQVDIEGPFPLEVGDTFLLCSDGLSGQLQDEEIGAILATLPPDKAARALIDLANLRGGPDNITVIIAHVAELPPQAQDGAADLDQKGARVHPLLWLVGAVCLAVAGCLAALRQWVPAALSGAGVLAAMAAAMWQRALESNKPQLAMPSEPLGKGPHTSHAVAVNRNFAETIAQLARKVSESASEENLSIEWAPFEQQVDRAARASAAGDYAGAIRQYATAISHMMNEARHQQDKRGSSAASAFEG